MSGNCHRGIGKKSLTLKSLKVQHIDACNISADHISGGSTVTLASAGAGETLVNDGTAPDLAVKSLTAGLATNLNPTATDIEINSLQPITTVLNPNTAVPWDNLSNTTMFQSFGVGPAVVTISGIRHDSPGFDMMVLHFANSGVGSTTITHNAGGLPAGSFPIITLDQEDYFEDLTPAASTSFTTATLVWRSITSEWNITNIQRGRDVLIRSRTLDQTLLAGTNALVDLGTGAFNIAYGGIIDDVNDIVIMLATGTYLVTYTPSIEFVPTPTTGGVRFRLSINGVLTSNFQDVRILWENQAPTLRSYTFSWIVGLDKNDTIGINVDNFSDDTARLQGAGPIGQLQITRIANKQYSTVN